MYYDFRQLNETADIKTLYERITGNSLRKHSQTWEGACPQCGGTDRFYIYADDVPQHWFCRQCHPEEKGSHAYTAMDFIKVAEHMEGQPITAVAERLAWYLNISPSDCAQYKPGTNSNRADQRQQQQFAVLPNEPSNQWQMAVSYAVDSAHKFLMSDAGRAKREYLYSRGFTDETIEKYRIGFNTEKYLLNATDKNGDFVTATTGFYIPTFTKLIDGDNSEALMKVKVRIDNELEKYLKSQGKKYQKYWYISGGESKSLFCAEYCRDYDANDRIIYTEGELDAIAINQCADGICKAVTFGSHSNVSNVAEEWHPWLSAPENTIICFDNETDETKQKQVRFHETELQSEIIKSQSLDAPKYRASAPVIKHLPAEYHDWDGILMQENGAQIIRNTLENWFEM